MYVCMYSLSKHTITYMKYIYIYEISKRKANGIGHFCVETAFYNGLLKERYKGG